MEHLQPVDILAIGVHPDDIELSCTGTLLKHIALGYKVGLCDLTMGQLGSRGTPELRLQEAEHSRALMKAEWRVNLGMEDGFFSYDESHIRSIIKVIRASKAKIVLANALSDRHPDHGKAAKLISDSCFYSGLAKIETTYNNRDQEPHRPQVVYHYIQDKDRKADFVVDISPYFDQKIECILAFKTQFFNEDIDGPTTPISSKQFMEFMQAKNKVYGRDILADYAEAFNVERLPGVRNLFDLV